jgi:two-component system chemotaxis sensor kinase CheA
VSALPDDLDPDLEAAFADEASECVEQLGTQLGELEVTPDSAAAIREAFRCAHSLKGLFAATGLHVSLGITHALEDVLSRLRDEDLTADDELLALLFEACDLVAAQVDSVRATRAEADHLAPEAERVRDLLDAMAQRPASSAPATAPVPPEDVRAAIAAEGLQLLSLTVELDPACAMPAVRAYQVVAQLQSVSDVLASEPPVAELEAGTTTATTLHTWVATERSAEHVRAQALACADVAAVTSRPWVDDARERAPEPVRAEDPATPQPAPVAVPGAAARTVRVDSERLDALMHSVGELLVHRARVENIASSRLDPELRNAVDELSRAAQEMQSMVMDVRMVDVDTVFRRMPRVVRDLARELGKDVQLRISGSSTELDRTVVDLLGDPLTHLVRNAIDHGIESPEEREQAGKPREATLSISAVASGGVVVVRVQDDGRGMRPDLVRRRAVERGLLSAEDAAELDDDAAIQLCFRPGFSTREQVTEVSGRGVGLDVVRSKLRSLGGDVTASSSEDGTLMTMKLPLTLAIVSVLLVRSAGQVYAVPALRVRASADEIGDVVRSIGGHRSILHEDSTIPLVELGGLLGEPSRDGSQVVVVEGLGRTVALVVDEVLSLAEVVTRPIPTVVESSRYLSASAMLGDGGITFLVDTEAVVDSVSGGLLHA